MKKALLLLLTSFIFQINAQFVPDATSALIGKEKKAFLNKMNVGNVNPNTLNYDLRYQRMDLAINPAVYYVSGSVTSHFIPNQNISSIYFDLTTQLTVSQVVYQGANLNFQQLASNEVKIDFPTVRSAGVLDSLSIHYSGAPAPGYNAFTTTTQNGTALLSTLSEPYGAQDWFPTKQSLNDKIENFDIKITAPAQYNVASNGTLMSEIALTGGQKRTFWRTQYPTAAYLIAIAVTNYTKLNDVIGSPPFPFVNYIYPSTVNDPTAMANIEWTKQAMNTFETYFGAYPFRNEKYGHMQFQFGGGMEHQTMSSMGGFSKQLIAHELAHQWFGDKVTCGAWNDIWLNEGFATFGEHLVNEKLIMTPVQFMNYLEDQKDYITSSPGGSTYVADANLGSVNAIFNGRLSYAKGGYIVRMLKWALTDPVFYQAIKDYHQRPDLAYSYVRTTDLNTSLQTSTGKDFTEFFNDWVYGQGYPTYNIRWKQNSNQSITIQALQTTSHPSVSFYEMPLPIKVNGTGGQVVYLKPEHTANGQYFNFPLNFTVASVQFNYEHQILEKNSTVVMDASLSTAETAKENISVYPVPAGNEINISGLTRPADFQIFFTDGKLVKAGNYTPGKPLNISELVPGNYILAIGDGNYKFIKK
ncbi:T9SS type A sorting domain-containing protein [Marnyiella aurantia]|uniref:Aminopeptidase N n=1 Tax=Marnyiella aurantia TaxID=2758037 RepID=A0A7D7LMF7_9FLAO|nr:M1 family aminopeptidase [Marnyiella aurantia]MBA5246238.1 T9SS type A sorting domain-containing protein [Marnyiella aurantia]QMS98384.1 T9SS type A sorting domain-containing protein [Marnyiella aurantia]